ncbi:MAG: hypothetical protein ACRDNS_32650, partial [Trebonia sp.]
GGGAQGGPTRDERDFAPEYLHRGRYCTVKAMRAMGLWSAADDAIVEARYGPDAITGHVYCCDPVAREARYAAMRAAGSPWAPGL